MRLLQWFFIAMLATWMGAANVSAGEDLGETVQRADVLVYGATPGGIAAALSAARTGDRVLLVEPTAHVGGMTTSGLSHSDFRTFEGLTGTFLDFSRRVEAYYRDRYGDDASQVAQSWRGTHGEPHVNEAVFEQMLADKNVEVWRETQLVDLHMKKAGTGQRIERLEFCQPGADCTADGGDADKPESLSVVAQVCIDATYEGDLMAAAGVPWRVGREGRDEYGESLAPEQADGQLQGYNFRFIMTRDPELRMTVEKPEGYRREDFTGLLPLLGDRIKKVFDYPRNCVFKAHKPELPNGKFDINDVSGGAVRLSMPGENLAWPDGDWQQRQEVFDHHLRYHVGLLWFLQHDSDVPAAFREEARQWGWCRDEFTDNGHLPWQLYVREARRMVGQYVFTESDTDAAPGDARSVFHSDAIAFGDYGPNCHGTAHEGPRYGGRHTGEFYKRVAPYQVPYGVLVPRSVENLLVPVAASASHVGFCALRLEPIWMSLGQAAGEAARLAVDEEIPVQDVPVERVQRRLHATGAGTIYVSDVPPDSPLFTAVQWIGARSGLHGLEPAPPTHGKLGTNIEGQYFEAFPGHAFRPQRPLDAELRERWLDLIPEELREQSRQAIQEETTRGEAVRVLYEVGRG